jgi:hypothetical protein
VFRAHRTPGNSSANLRKNDIATFVTHLDFQKEIEIFTNRMEYNMELPTPVELNDAELDAVAAGANANAGAGGLVAAAIAAAVDNVNVEVLNNNKVNILNDALNGNKTNVGAGVLVNLLGGPAIIRGTQTA